jgi:hypothetical protein
VRLNPTVKGFEINQNLSANADPYASLSGAIALDDFASTVDAVGRFESKITQSRPRECWPDFRSLLDGGETIDGGRGHHWNRRRGRVLRCVLLRLHGYSPKLSGLASGGLLLPTAATNFIGGKYFRQGRSKKARNPLGYWLIGQFLLRENCTKRCFPFSPHSVLFYFTLTCHHNLP